MTMKRGGQGYNLYNTIIFLSSLHTSKFALIMAAKKNKAKKEAIDKRQWLELPQEIIQLLSHNQRINLLHYVSTIGTTKSWIPTTSRCDRNVERRRWPQLYRIDDSSCYSGNYPYTDRKAAIYPYINQKVAMVGSRVMIRRSDCCILRGWADCECIVVDPFDAKKKYMEFTSVVACEGKLCALSMQGALAVIEKIDARLTITGICSNRAVPSVSSRSFKEFLVELNEEILLIFLIHQKSLKNVEQVEVFRLDFAKLDWIEVERLKGKALFLDQSCIWVNSAEIGCRGDCVYFTQGSDGGWWMYDMDSGCISPV